MRPELFGIEHILYIIISTLIGSGIVLFSIKYKNDEKKSNIILKVLGSLLFISIMINRLSQVFRYDDVKWYLIIPESYCGMTSLVLSLAVIFGKKIMQHCILFG